MNVMDMENPFADEADFRQAKRDEIITAGRYRLPNRDGSHKPGGRIRMTNLCAAISDQFGLRIWEIEQVLIAITARPDMAGVLSAEMHRIVDFPKKERRAAIERLLERCKAISGGDEGARFGNGRHSLVEADHLAMPLPATDAYARTHLSLYRTALVRNELEPLQGMQERCVLNEDLDAIGTLDNIVRDLRTNRLHIADLKTQKKFWTWLEVAAQLSGYARAVAMWEPSDPKKPREGRWVDMPKVDLNTAFVLWMPREKKDVDVYEVDIEAGWRTAQLCAAVVKDRAGGKRKTEPRARLREARAVNEVEAYAARFAAVDSRAEGIALVAEVKRKGLWNEVLAGEARAAAERLEKNFVAGVASY